MVCVNILLPNNVIYALFIERDDENVAIPSMPGFERHSWNSMMKEVSEA